MSGGPSTPIEQVTELGEGIIQKLVVAGITTVEALADMTPEQLEEIPGIGEKTLEKISVAVRHYFGQYEEGEERPVVAGAEPAQEPGQEPGQEAAQSAADAEAIAAEDASLAEEEDALKLDLTQEGEEGLRPDASDEEGSGLIRDEVAEEQLAELTETGGELETEGGEALEPGREDT